MTAATALQKQQQPDIEADDHVSHLPAITGERLPWHPGVEQRFGVNRSEWRALVESVWPSAKTLEGVILALSYCTARKLDPFKRPVHIVPIWNSQLGKEVETVWPGIGELRTTASRTGYYAGCDAAEFGPMKTETFTGMIGRRGNQREVAKEVTFPEWCQITVYRMVQGQRVAFPGPRVYWLETYATVGQSDVPNDMWETRAIGQLEKCAEAAALRRAFPEEIGEYIADEAGHQRIQVVAESPAIESKRGAAGLTEKLKGGQQPDVIDQDEYDAPVETEQDTADTQPEATAESSDDSHTNGPPHYQVLIDLLAGKCDCANDKAEKRLAEYAKKLHGVALADLTDKQITDTKAKIADGSLKV